jgi:hypothetical protein
MLAHPDVVAFEITSLIEFRLRRLGHHIRNGAGHMILDYVALVLLILVVVILFYGIIAIHDIPYEMAKKRNHPHQDAIHVGGWISLFTLHTIWPFLWIWATVYRPDRGYGFSPQVDHAELQRLRDANQALEARVAALETRIPGEDA